MTMLDNAITELLFEDSTEDITQYLKQKIEELAEWYGESEGPAFPWCPLTKKGQTIEFR